jgi:hypothetical protein
MVENIIFYNHWGAGDIFESREFVKEIIRKLPKENHLYAHNKYSSILKDMTELGFSCINGNMDMFKDVSWKNNDCMINTWIGRDSSYVLPGTGCIIEKNYEMFNAIFSKLGISKLDKPVYEYLPVVDWSCYNINPINKFVEEHSNLVIICTGIVNSCQSTNFDFTPVISQLCDRNPKFNFIITTPMTKVVKNNLFRTYDIFGSSGDDLNEIGYLSKSCNLIVGRNSGPFVFCQHRDNWMDANKTLLSFTTEKDASTFVLSNHLPLKKVWCGKTDTSSVIKAIEENLHE